MAAAEAAMATRKLLLRLMPMPWCRCGKCAKQLIAADAVRPIILFSLVSRDDAVGVSSSSTKSRARPCQGRFMACGVFWALSRTRERSRRVTQVLQSACMPINQLGSATTQCGLSRVARRLASRGGRFGIQRALATKLAEQRLPARHPAPARLQAFFRPTARRRARARAMGDIVDCGDCDAGAACGVCLMLLTADQCPDSQHDQNVAADCFARRPPPRWWRELNVRGRRRMRYERSREQLRALQ